jgi:hypothetical protein
LGPEKQRQVIGFDALSLEAVMQELVEAAHLRLTSSYLHFYSFTLAGWETDWELKRKKGLGVRLNPLFYWLPEQDLNLQPSG